MSLWGEFTLTTHLVLLILAAVSFFLAALDVKFPRLQLMPLGLFFWVLALVLYQR